MSEMLEQVVLLSPLPYSTAGFAPIVLMNEMGFDREEGLQVTVRDLGVPGNAWRALMNREGDATFINTIFTFLARDKGLDMRIFACYARYQNRSFVVAAESATRSIEELRDSTVGLFSLDHEEFAMATLRAHGVDPEREVKFINYRTTKSFEADKMAAALKSGEIKAIWLLDIMYGHLAAEGIKVRRLPSRTVDSLTPASVLCTNDEVLAKRPGALAGLTRALTKATVFANANPEQAIRMVWKHEPRNLPAAGQEEQSLRRDRIGLEARLKNHGVEDPAKPLAVVSASEIEAWRDFLLETKAISKRLPIDDYYTPELTKHANEFDAAALAQRARAFN